MAKMPRSERDAMIVKERAQGFSYTVLGQKYGVTRQRVFQICRRGPMPNYDDVLKTPLARWMWENGITVNEMADKLQCSGGTVLALRKGRMPKRDYIRDALLETTGMRMEQLYPEGAV